MRSYKLIVFYLTTIFLSLLSNTFLSAQILEPVKWKFESKKTGENTFELIFKAEIAKGWSVYSQYTGDDGPVPTEITYENVENANLEGASKEEGDKSEGYDKLFDTQVIKFTSKQPYVIKQEVKINGSKASIEGFLTFMTCDDTKCLPPTDVDFSFTLHVSSSDQTVSDSKIADSEFIAQVDNTPESDNKSENTNTPSVASGIQLNLKEDSPLKPGMLEPVSWSFSHHQGEGNEAVLHFQAIMEEGWSVYSQHTDDNGPIPTEIVFEEMNDLEMVGDNEESGTRKEGVDPIFNVNVIKFSHTQPYLITQKVNLTGANPYVRGYITYMTCDDSKCLLFDEEFFIHFSDEPVEMAYAGDDLFNAKIELTSDGKILDQTIPAILQSYKSPLSECEDATEENKGYFWIFIFGFIGGLLALLTPCVFPMIPITVSFFTKDNKRKGWANGTIYGLSIIVIYVAIGLLITIMLGPEALNRLSTNWIANSLFFLIFIGFAFSFFGYYEITLPSSWTNKSDKMADKGGLIGIFFMAFTLALVSFSCTGPIIGTAIVQAASKGEYIGPFIVMFGFSLALALPFGLFAAFPSWLNSLPRSGSWMNTVKVSLGFLELALAFKFLSVADMTNHWGFLKYELFLGLWILIFLGLTLYLFGFIRFPHDSPVKKLSPSRIGFASLFLIFTIYLGTGFNIRQDTGTYNALGLMSGLAPPAQYNFFLPPQDLDQDIKSRYPSFSKCANNIDCFKDYYEGLAYAKEVNKPILLDFTGYGCVNCRKTEEHIWVEDRIRTKLNDDVVLVSLYVDDDQKLEEMLISKSRGKKIRNIGNKWADFQIVNLEQNSQPLYVLMTPSEQVISTPRPFKEGVDGYNRFLDCGLQSFLSLTSN